MFGRTVKVATILLLCIAPLASTQNVGAAPACEGNACSVTQHTWDAGARCQRFTNLDASRGIRVELHNWAAGNTLDLAPGESKCAFLQLFELPYRANFR